MRYGRVRTMHSLQAARIEADTALLEQTQAELDRASAALAVFQTQPPRRVRPVFLTGRRD